MTEKRFTLDNEENGLCKCILMNGEEIPTCEVVEFLNTFIKENEQLKKELLFFYDVANCECSTNWRKDMEKGCKRFFNCTYEEAKEKYGDYDGTWWEINE